MRGVVAMTMRERFTDSEWQELLHIPFDGFLMVAYADQHLDPEELAAFLETITRAAALKDPLHREICMDLAGKGGAGIQSEMAFEARETGPEMTVRVQRSKAVLKDKLTKAEYEGFLGSVMLNAVAVAAATGKHKVFGKKKQNNISEEEARALAAFCVAWDLDPAEVMRHYAAA